MILFDTDITWILTHGFYGNYGTAYVSYKSFKGTICKSTSWSNVEADIFCKTVGYQYGGYAINVSNHDIPRWITNVTCNGTETSFGECNFEGWGQMDDCSDSPEAGVLCFGNSCKYDFFLKFSNFTDFAIFCQFNTII